MLSCFPVLDNGEAKKKNNRKRLSYICLKKKKKNLCVISNVVPWGGESHLISILLVSMEIYMGKSIGMKVANDQISILQRLFRG